MKQHFQLSYKISSVQFSCSVVSDSLWPHRLQHVRPPCSSPTPGVYSNPCPLHRWCHPITSCSVIPFSSCLQFFPASGAFPMSQFFASDGQNIGVSALASVLPMNIQDWFPLGWTSWISLLSKGLSSLLQHHSSKASLLWRSAFFVVQLSHPYMTTGKTIALIRWTLVGKVMSLFFNMLSRLVITFLPRSKRVNFMAAATICSDSGAQKNSLPLFPLFPHRFAMNLMWRVDSLEKTLMLGGIGGKRRRGRQRMMAGWHHWLDGLESEWTPGVGDGQGGLACCNSWGREESDMTERLIWSDGTRCHDLSFLNVEL